MTDKKLEGTQINIEGKEYFITPISFETWRGIGPHGDLAKDNGAELVAKAINVLIKTIHAALSRNYPDMTKEKIAELLHFDKSDSLDINPEKISNSLRAANPIMETILKISSLAWEWNPQITKH